MSYAQTQEDAKKRGLDSSGGWFTIKDGEKKKVRFISEAAPVRQLGQNYAKPGDAPKSVDERLRVQYLVYVIDREVERIKPYGMPKSVFNQLVSWEKDEEYGWATDLPPFDFIIERSKETGKVVYTLKPSRKETELTEAEMQEIEKKEPVTILAEKQQRRYDIEIEAARQAEIAEDDGDPGPQDQEPDDKEELPTIQQDEENPRPDTLPPF